MASCVNGKWQSVVTPKCVGKCINVPVLERVVEVIFCVYSYIKRVACKLLGFVINVMG